jgi:hypothetical protein
MRKTQVEYDRVKPRFTNAKGKVQYRWADKSIRQMAEEVGLLNIYEVAYSAASDLHHMPFAGVIGHELNWLREGLFVAHGALLGTVVTLYNVLHEPGTDFKNRLKEAINNFSYSREK